MWELLSFATREQPDLEAVFGRLLCECVLAAIAILLAKISNMR